ncbi:FAD-dependent pyridine nucleotide-disulphide oxidoreductase [Chloroherpeton thalassium ATCC 35110]|uniref:Ferredoxin--NADP reductase 2 n=1 Tax=Chloroherpeton thalassium (strain ATCC 35110 / GB-78) TaxID=517418 RepID=FENR2_CHLT3|nr:NAD(P)/FAD-dependent oxidoreductase [Chloroherpeton thalassium]B3QXR3.1 RecName: Full=Ferredoxin--NADP reductase 2; Short=FNR 2; Short=Fd-NADP(+) reductase 2 [Chloroherpeton thalassium ATCC 35110]ACF14978.1 FAD-dependent pyridine nucleotide-disulphide oxidoreductase [Chloroherpeton thalassium ATCC 35110]
MKDLLRQENNEVADITIIGAGPIGLYAAFYAGLRTMKARVVDSLPQIGGQLTALYPKKAIYDVAGYPKIVAEALIANLAIQASQYHPEILTSTQITEIHRNGALFELFSEDGRQFLSKTVLIAAGVGAFAPRKLPMEEAVKWEGNGLFYFVQDPTVFFGKKVLIIGGGDSALDWAMALMANAEVTLIHRRDKFTAHEDSVEKVRKSPANIKTFYELKSIVGKDSPQGKELHKVVIFNNKTNEETTLEVDAILCNLGFSTNLGPIKNWGVEILNNAVKVDVNMATNVTGIYAAGDIVWHPAKLKLIATGFAEAAIAINNAKTIVEPHANFFPGHSSSSKEKK